MKILGHRGCRNEEPENTLLGFTSSITKGVDAIELDIHKTKDSHIVVIHDNTVDRTTDGTGRILDFNLTDLLKLDAGKGEKIPLLIEVLKLLEPTNLELQIEIKAPDLEQDLVKLLQNTESKMKDRCTVISFNHRWLKTIKELDPSIRTTVLYVATPINPVQMAEDALADGISVGMNYIDRELVSAAHKKNFHVTAWNINSPEDYRRMKACGVDLIGTDAPSEIVPLNS